MKKQLLLLLLMLLPVVAVAQEKLSVVTLKNGTVLKGTIKSINPTDALTIVIAGVETSIKMTEVAKIEEENKNSPISQLEKSDNLNRNISTGDSELFVALTDYGRFCFNVLSKTEKTVEVTHSKNVKYTDEKVIIPSTVDYNGNTYTVIAIGEEAFNENKKIKHLVLPSTVKSIGEKAFEQCKYLEQIDFSQGLEYIGEKAFSQCINLIDIALPSGLIEIGGNAFFFDKKLKKVELPISLKIIKKEAFAYCIEITEIILPIGLERIEDRSFFATKLEKIDIPNKVAYIGVQAFLSGTSFIAQESIIKWLSIPESVLEIGKDAFCKFRGGFGNTLPSKCHIEVLPSWVNVAEAKRIGLSEDSYEDYISTTKK